MLMTDAEIQKAIKAQDIAIEPHSEDHFKPLAYVARLGSRALVGSQDTEIDVETGKGLVLEAGEFVLFTTLENFKLGSTIAGHLGVRTHLARKGFVLLAGMHIDPGWEGHLVLGGYNASPRKLVLDHGTEIVAIEFHQLASPPKRRPGISLEQKDGRLPEIDKDYLRNMETQSLSKLGEEVRKLTQSVATLTLQMKYMMWGLGLSLPYLTLVIALINLFAD